MHLRLNDLLHHFTKGRLRYLAPSFCHLPRALKSLDLRKLGFDVLVAFIVLRYRCLSIDEESRHAVEVLSLREDEGFVPYVVSLELCVEALLVPLSEGWQLIQGLWESSFC